ncbi:PHP domain-containing protein [bacterium]|nr:PHP domain-containing protein [bacterium]
MSNIKSCKDLYDLHLHTYWSYDATAHPENYFKRARELGVCCLAIADHHVLDSLEEVLEIAKEYPEVWIIPAAELSVTTSIGAVDLLCYGFPRKLSEELQRIFAIYHAWQRAAGEARSKGLQALGYDFTDDHRLELLQSYRPSKAIEVQGNTHVKNAVLRKYFVERGFIANEEDYSALMNRARKAVHFPPYPDVADVVPVIKQAGVLVAIAHPYGYFNGYDLSKMDVLREECCLDGIECINKSKVPPEYTQLYRKYCVQHGLFSVAGSDCHSDEDIPDIFAHHRGFPHHEGSDKWLNEFLNRLTHSFPNFHKNL